MDYLRARIPTPGQGGISLKKKVRLFVLVQDDEHEIIEQAIVKGCVSKGRFRNISYNKNLHRHVLEKLEPGPFEIRVRGPDGTTEELRKINLKSGDNYVSVMLGKPSMLDFNAGGMKYYFTPREDVLLLSIRGAKDEKQISKIMREAQLKFEVLADANGRIIRDDMLLLVNIGTGTEAAKNRTILEQMVTEDFLKHGLTGRIATPVYKGEKPVFGFTNEIIVRFKSWVTVSQINNIAAEYDLFVERNIPYLGNTYLLKKHVSPSYEILDIIKKLQEHVEVVYVEPNILQRLQNFQHTPNDYLYDEVPHLQLINCHQAWQILGNQPGGNSGGSPDITIAVLDIEGVDPQHPDLTGQLSDGTQKMVANFDFVNMNNQLFANVPGEHGTQSAGSATALMGNNIGIPGVAPNCHLVGGRFSAWSTQLDIADIWVWMAGFPYPPNPTFPAQIARGADVISNSWGPTNVIPPSQTLRDVFDFLATFGREGRGCIVCFSAGNLGYVLLDNRNPYATDEKTVAVGSSINTNPTNPCDSIHADHNGNMNNLPAVVDTRSYYSPFGLTIDLVSPSHTCYDVALPGARIRDPIMAPVRTDRGDWPEFNVVQTTLTNAVAQGTTILQVTNSAGFQVGDFVLLGGPGVTPNETKEITGVLAGQINIRALENAYPAGTIVISGPNNCAKNPMVGFGGTSHSCPTVAGAATLLLSVKPDLSWIEVRNILRDTADHIDIAQTNATGQWIDFDGDAVVDFSQWYGHGRLNVQDAVNQAIALTPNQRADVVIRDNLDDTGAVPALGWLPVSCDVWVRQTDDPIPTQTQLPYSSAPNHQNPLYGQDNYVYLRVKNVGQDTAPLVYVRALISHFPGVEFEYPDGWQPTPRFGEQPTLPLEPGTYLIGEEQVTDLGPGEVQIVKMTWEKDLVPPEKVTTNGTQVKWHPCILAEVSPHDGPGPGSNPHTIKWDNNLAHRNISIDYPPQGSGSSFISAVIAGSKHVKGVDAVLIDRTRLPHEYTAIIQVPDAEVMSDWMEIIESGKGVEIINPLGEPTPIQEKITEARRLEHLLEYGKKCQITLLDKARLAIRSQNDSIIIIHAPAHTCIEMLCKKRPSRLREGLSIGEYRGRKAILMDHRANAVSLPLRLSKAQFLPLFIGMDRPGIQTSTRGTIRVSQLRTDHEVPPGYEIRG